MQILIKTELTSCDVTYYENSLWLIVWQKIIEAIILYVDFSSDEEINELHLISVMQQTLQPLKSVYREDISKIFSESGISAALLEMSERYRGRNSLVRSKLDILEKNLSTLFPVCNKQTTFGARAAALRNSFHNTGNTDNNTEHTPDCLDL